MSKIYDEVDPSYAALCSDITLYSDQKGFFRELVEDVLELASSRDWMKSFQAAEGDAGKLGAVNSNEELTEGLTEVLSRIEPLYRPKDGKISREKRLEAENVLRNGNMLQALALISQAVLKAPMKDDLEMVDGGISLALALWLRSEVLLKIGKPLAALEDLKQALKERLPAKMRAEYYWRVGHCYRDSGEPVRAKVSYELAGRLLASNETAKHQLEKDIADLSNVECITQAVVQRHAGAILSGGSKQSMPSLSVFVKISEDETKGRFAVANSQIKTGDVLLTESPYASCLRPDNFGSHCLHCFKRLADCKEQAPSWCPKCSGVAFCSTKCRDTAVGNYHKYECQFLDVLIGSGMSVLSHLALRMITQAGLDICLSIHAKYNSNSTQTIESSAVNEIEGVTKKSRMKNRKNRLDRRQKGLKTIGNKDEKEVDKESDNKADDKVSFEENLELKAAQIYSLCAHSELRSPEDYLKRIVMALFLVECLKKANFFGDCEEETLQKYKKAICELLLKNLQLLQFNAHEIYETLYGKHMFSSSKIVYIAVGIYPTGALFNHECYPAVTRYFEGRDIILRAVRPLAPGEVVSENYGPHFLVRTLKDRQRALTCRYWFRCDCTACKEDWPMLKQMDADSVIGFKCPNKECKARIRASPQWPNRCPKCSTTVDKKQMSCNLETVKICVKQYQEGARQIEEENPVEAINVMCPSVDSFHEVARCPHKETHLAQEALRTCFATLGNVQKVGTKGELKKE